MHFWDDLLVIGHRRRREVEFAPTTASPSVVCRPMTGTMSDVLYEV